MPVIGATVTGLLAVLAVLVVLASEGLVAAIAVLAAILVVQQVEGNVFQARGCRPRRGGSSEGHAARHHRRRPCWPPIISEMIAAPIVSVGGTVLRYAREQPEEG